MLAYPIELQFFWLQKGDEHTFKCLLHGGIHGWGTTFGCLTVKGLDNFT